MTHLFKLIAGIIALVLLTVLTGCEKSKVYKIGVSQCSQDDWRAKMNDEINREIMFHDDAIVEIRSADDNNEKQIADIHYFAENGFDIIIVSPNEADALTPTVKNIYESGIPVIIFDRNINGDSYTARIGVDNNGLGKSAAHYARHILGTGANAIEIYGLPGSTPARERHDGFAAQFISEGGNILASVPGNWNKDDAIYVTDSLMRIYDNIDLIYAHNDRMAIGAAEVTRRLGRDNIKIIGIDAAPAIGIQAVADSIIDATFLYPTEGQRLIRTALAILKGEAYEKDAMLPVSSAVDLTNADILLLQNEALKEETRKIQILKTKIDDYWDRHSSQTSLFYASIVIIILMVGVVFLILRAYWQHRSHQETLMAQNKELEEQRDMQRNLNDKLKSATQSKLMFFTNVSHDLRTPLTLIAEPINQLACASNLSEQQHNLIRIADKNVRILHRLINQILDFRKFENNRMQLHLSEANLSECISEWMESFYSLARKRNLNLDYRIANNSATTTLAIDVEKIERVFFNLLSNAFKYTPDNGTIAVNFRMDETNAYITVADTGEGISERDLGNIFDRFYQVDRVHPNGSGIGLSLSKAFIELHGGTISVKSELTKGSEFTVILPIKHTAVQIADNTKLITSNEVEAELDTIESGIKIDTSKPLLLVIDDNKDIRTLLTELMGTDYCVINAANGNEGIRKAVKYVPDLIICDVMMPVMDGLECCKRLKSEITTSHIPVLMLTACSMDEQRVQGYDSGADGYLAKPFNCQVLRARCSALIENRKRIKELWTQNNIIKGVSKPNPKPVSDIDNQFYSRFLEIFQTEIGNPELSVDAIASRMGLERTQLYRKIKSLTNYSPVELIRKLRLQEGMNLLKSTEKTISEIAYETGFSTPAYFTKCYREAYGETPSETRNKLS